MLTSSSPSHSPVTVTTSITPAGGTTNGHLSSPEPEGLSTNHVSRIDKWKAKHQAMLKMVAEENKGHGGRNSPSPPLEALESTNKLVITLEKGDEKDSYPTAAPAPRPQLNTALVV